MALDFPANPTNGQIYGSYVYNSTVGAWQSKEDPATVAVTSPTAPLTANNGDIWYNTNTGVSYVYYADGTSAQWVEIISSAIPALSSKANLIGDNWFSGGVNYYGTGDLNGTFISSNTGRAQFTVNNAAATPLTVKGTTSQTADLQQWINVSNTVLAEVDSAGIITAPRFVSTQATGTAPFSVASTTAVANLNADLLDGQHGSVYSPAGMVSQFAGATAPTGWLLCDGTAVSRTTYAGLFAAIGTNYGTGDGSTTFNLPNLKGRIPVGLDSAQTEFNTLNAPGGVKSTSLTVSHIPQHNHSIDHDHAAFTASGGDHSHLFFGDDGASSPGGYSRSVAIGYDATSNNTTGNGGDFVTKGSGAHSHTIDVPAFSGTSGNYGSATVTPVSALQPYIVMNYIIKV
jgi:microcystin-dependent protein